MKDYIGDVDICNS